MVEVLLTFLFGPEFDEARVRQVAEAALGESNTTPGLCSKELMIDAANHGAVYLYSWDSEDAAKAFFTADRIELITALYGVRPSIRFNHQLKTIVLAARNRKGDRGGTARTSGHLLELEIPAEEKSSLKHESPVGGHT